MQVRIVNPNPKQITLFKIGERVEVKGYTNRNFYLEKDGKTGIYSKSEVEIINEKSHLPSS